MLFGKRRKLAAAGSAAPEFRLTRLGGGSVTLAELIAGGPALLAFFKISCPVCQLTLPFLERLHVGGSLPIYGISQNDADDTRDFARRYRLTLPMLLDREDEKFPASNAYGISSVPTQFLIEPDGRIGPRNRRLGEAGHRVAGHPGGYRPDRACRPGAGFQSRLRVA